eukprot:1156747-Pelagomonas_calceolata.AAC.2
MMHPYHSQQQDGALCCKGRGQHGLQSGMHRDEQQEGGVCGKCRGLQKHRSGMHINEEWMSRCTGPTPCAPGLAACYGYTLWLWHGSPCTLALLHAKVTANFKG